MSTLTDFAGHPIGNAALKLRSMEHRSKVGPVL
jgi:hypothetical protein